MTMASAWTTRRRELQRVTYDQTIPAGVQDRLDDLINTDFTPDYGAGAAQVDIIVVPALSAFTLDDGTAFSNNGTALPPASSGLPGASLNTTENCLVIYDTQQRICVARDGTGGDLDLPISNAGVLYHEFSHAFRILNNTLLALGGGCDPASPEENAAILDENDLRTQIASRLGEAPQLRDPNIHCGQVCEGGESSCCIIATVLSKSLTSPQVQALRRVRDHFVRRTEVGHAFFENFFRDYYSFSPQVCTIMAKHPRVGDHLLEGYVMPLLTFWQLIIARIDGPLTAEELGALFRQHHPDRDASRRRLEALQATARYWYDPAAMDDSLSGELIQLLQERAWPSEYMQWAVVRPVRIYHDVLVEEVAGATDADLGEVIANQLDRWLPDVPLASIWAALPKSKVRRELKFYETSLLQSAPSRKRFRERLGDRFSEITAVQTALSMGAV